MANTFTIDLNTGDYLTMGVSPVSVSLTEQRIQIALSVCELLLERDVWEPMTDSVWDAWEANITELIEGLQDY